MSTTPNQNRNPRQPSKGAAITHPAAIERIPLRDALLCLVCRKPGPDLDIDHVQAKGMGGSAERDVPENKVPLCRPCHDMKHSRRIRTRVRDVSQVGASLFEWRWEKSDLWIRVPVRVNDRHGCLDFATEDPTAGAQLNTEGTSTQVSASPAVGSGRAGSAAAKPREAKDMRPLAVEGGLGLAAAPPASVVGKVPGESGTTPRYKPAKTQSRPDTKVPGESGAEGHEAGSAAADTQSLEPATQGLAGAVSSEAPSAAVPPASGRKEAMPSGPSDGSAPKCDQRVEEGVEAGHGSSAAEAGEPEPLESATVLASAGSSAAPPSVFTLETWREEGQKLADMGHALKDATSMWQFAVGDWFLRGENTLGEEVYGHIEEVGFGGSALRQYSWVAAKVSPDTRIAELSWTHHRTIAHKEPPEQKELLALALEENLDTKEFHRLVHGEKPRVKRWSFAELEGHLCHTCREVLSLMEAR